MTRLAGKVAIITGAAQGLGRSIALRYAEEGCALSLCDLNLAGAQETAALAAEHGAATAAFRTDVTDRGDVDALIEGTVAELGGIDILVNNAGIFFNVSFDEMSVEQWQKTLDVNLTSLFHVTQATVRYWLANGRGGSIVNLSSISAYIAFTDSSHYCVTKAGVAALTRSLAMEYGAFGIRANAMAPGIIATDMTRRSLEDPSLSDGWLTRISARRYGTPEDVANLALFLASDESNYVNGELITVDGGATFAWPKPSDAERTADGMALMAVYEMIPTLPAVQSFVERSHGLLIDGAWQPAASGETFVTENPATGEPLSTLAAGDGADVDRAGGGCSIGLSRMGNAHAGRA